MSVPGEEADPSQGEDEEPEAPEAEAGDAEPTEPEKPLSRKERRAALDEARADNQRLTDRIAESDRRLAETNASVAEMRGYIAAQVQQTRQRADDGGVAAQVDQLESEAQRHLLAAQNSKSPEVAQAEFKEFQRKSRQAGALETRVAVMSEIARERSTQMSPEVQRQGSQIAAEYPWLGENAVATAAAAALERQMIGEGKPANLVTSRAAAAEIGKRFGLNGASAAPGAANRGAYGGVPSREGASGAGGDGRPFISVATMDKDQKKLAELTFPLLEAKDAHKAWSSKMTAYFKANPNG